MKSNVLLNKFAGTKTLSSVINALKDTHQSERLVFEKMAENQLKKQNLSSKAERLKSIFLESNEPFGSIPLDEEFSKYLLSIGKVISLSDEDASRSDNLFEFEVNTPPVRATKDTQIYAVFEILKDDLHNLKHKAPSSVRYAVCKSVALSMLSSLLGSLGSSLRRNITNQASYAKIQLSGLVGSLSQKPSTSYFNKESVDDVVDSLSNSTGLPLNAPKLEKSPEELEIFSVIDFLKQSISGDVLKPITRLFLFEEYFLDSKDSIDFIIKAMSLYQEIIVLSLNSIHVSNSTTRLKLLCASHKFIELFGRLELFNLTSEYLPSQDIAFTSPVNSRTDISKFRYSSTTVPASFDFKKYTKFALGLQSSEFKLSIFQDAFKVDKLVTLDCFDSRLSVSCPYTEFSILDASITLSLDSEIDYQFLSNSKNYRNPNISATLTSKLILLKNKNILRVSFFDELPLDSNLTLKAIKSLKDSSTFSLIPVGTFNSKPPVIFTGFKALYDYLTEHKFRISKQEGFSYGFTVVGSLGKYRVSYNN